MFGINCSLVRRCWLKGMPFATAILCSITMLRWISFCEFSIIATFTENEISKLWHIQNYSTSWKKIPTHLKYTLRFEHFLTLLLQVSHNCLKFHGFYESSLAVPWIKALDTIRYNCYNANLCYFQHPWIISIGLGYRDESFKTFIEKSMLSLHSLYIFIWSNTFTTL